MKKNYNKITTKLGLLLLIVAICIGTNSFAQTVIWSTGFESGNSACTGSAGVNTTITQPFTGIPYAGTNSGRISGNANNTAYTGSIITGSTINFVAGRFYTINVYARISGVTGTLKIAKNATATNAAMVGSTGGDQLLWPGSANVTSTTYALKTVSFMASATESKYVGFQASGAASGGVTGIMYIDEITITEYIDAPCGLYCTANGNNNSTVGYIQNVNFNSGGIDRTSTYDNYVCTGASTTIVQSGTYTLSITRNANGAFPMYVGAWIDFSKDGDFGDASEQVFASASNSTSGAVTYTTAVNVPAGASLGLTKMRVISKYNAAINAAGCDVTTYNDVEDYDIYICQALTVLSPSTSTICSGSTAALSATTGYTTIQWRMSTDNVTFNDIAGATSSTYTTPALTATRYYTAVTTPACSGLTINTVTVTVSSTPTFTLQPASASQCRGTSTILSAGATPATSTYQWQYWNGASWANVANGTPANFTYTNATTANLTIATTTAATASTYQYRCNAVACATTSSSTAATLTVNAAPTAGTLSPTNPAATTCGTPNNPTLSIAGGTGTIQWQSSTDNSIWADVYAETTSSYSPTVGSTTYFRAVRTLNSCTSTTSTSTVTVSGATAATFNVASGAWGTATNWTPNGVPTTCTDVTIPSTSTVTVGLDAYCHNLTNNGTITLSFQSGKWLNVHGNLINNGTLGQGSVSGTGPQGQCAPCSGLQLNGQGALWVTNNDNYPNLTVSVGDNSKTTMINQASIDVLNATKTTVVGELNLGASTLKILQAFCQAGSIVRLNTGMLHLNITNSVLVDATTMWPEYGVYFRDYASGNWSIGDWTGIGSGSSVGTGFYTLWIRPNGGGSANFAGSQHCRGDFKIYAGGPVTWTASGNYNMRVARDFINEGDWTHNALNEVIMDGPGLVYDAQTNTYITNTARQNITGPVVTQFTELTINHSGTQGVQLNGVNASVGNSTTAGFLACTDGPFYLNSQTLTVNNGATTAITRTAGCVVSETNTSVNPSILTWNMGTTTGAHIVPFGTGDGAANYIPFTFNKTTAGSANISFSTRATAASDNLPWSGVSSVAAVSTMASYNEVTSTYYADATMPSVIDRWWDITTSAAVTANLTFSYKGSENTTTDNPTGEMKAQHWNGSDWDAPVGTGTGVTSGIGTVTATGQSTFSPWVISSLLIPLPVELEKFKADCDGEAAIFEWSTVSETNNNYFTLEKSLDGINYYEVGKVYSQVKGTPSSSSSLSYSFKDNNPTNAYYRLGQTDFSNNAKNLKLIHLNKCTTKKQFINAFSVNDAIVIQTDVESNEEVIATVMNSLGQVVATTVINLHDGFSEFKMENLGVTNGIYYLSITGKTIDTFNKKLLLAK